MIFSAAVAVALFASCDNAETKKVEVKDTTTTVDTKDGVATVKTTETTSTTTVPKFSTPEVQALADDYTKFVNESVAAAKSGDVSKIQELAAKQQEWATKTTAAASKFTPEDAKLWGEYTQKLATELTGVATK